MIYHFHDDFTTADKTKFRAAQTNDLAKICAFLETAPPNITYEVFASVADKQAADPLHSKSAASARFREMTIFRAWTPADDAHLPHEMTHLVAHTWARPYLFHTVLTDANGREFATDIDMVSTSFVQEGLAMAVDDMIFRRKLFANSERLDDLLAQFREKFPPLEQVINYDGFSEFDYWIGMTFAAGLCRHLLKNFPLDQFKRFYIALRETASPADNVRELEQIYQRSTADIVAKI